MKIRGNTVGTTMPRTNYEQTDSTKADYLRGREALNQKIESAQTAANNAQTSANNAQTAAENAQTAANNAQTAANNAQTAAGNAQTAADEHKNNNSNPHGVTAEQAGARPDTWVPTANDVGAVSMKLLWSNAAPYNAFAAQTISLDLSGYDYVQIHYRANSSGPVKSQTCKVGEKCHLDAVSGSSDGGMAGASFYSILRQATVSTTGVEFTKCVRTKQNSTSVTYEEATTSAVPHRIIGIKGVL